MASSRDSSTESKRSYNSEVVSTIKCGLSDATKIYCLEGLHCSQAKDKALPSPKAYSSWTSRWSRSKAHAVCAYTLLKVKRCLLLDENFLFDPLKQCSKVDVNKALWRALPGTVSESRYSLDAILSLCKVDTSLLKTLDVMLESLDETVCNTTEVPAINGVFRQLNEHASLAPDHHSHCLYLEFICYMGSVLRRCALLPQGTKVPEVAYETTFQRFVACLEAFIPGEESVHLCCDKTVDVALIEKINFPVELEGQKAKPLTLEVTSKPDLFIYQRPKGDLNQPRTVVAVVEAKGQKNGRPVHSDDEYEEGDDTLCDDIEEKFMNLSLSTLDEDDEDDDDDDDPDDGDYDIEETCILNSDWLANIRELPPLAQLALKKFLPQLIGEMFCASRSENMKYLVSKCGLLFGIGLVGFEVYFVTMHDSCQRSSTSVINSKSAYTKVFVTRPFNLLVKKDRRMIMKILAASFFLRLY